MSVKAKHPAQAGAYCPHCHLLIGQDTGKHWPAVPMRCPHCRLLVGAGRARSRPSSAPGAKGTAAGVFARQAKRGESDANSSPGEVLEALREASRKLGQPIERLLMVEYQQLTVVQSELPPLSDVLAAFGTWKGARREAAQGVQGG